MSVRVEWLIWGFFYIQTDVAIAHLFKGLPVKPESRHIQNRIDFQKRWLPKAEAKSARATGIDETDGEIRRLIQLMIKLQEVRNSMLPRYPCVVSKLTSFLMRC